MLALAALVAATLGLVATTATVVERRVEIGLLRSLGATARQLAALLMAETALVSLAGRRRLAAGKPRRALAWAHVQGGTSSSRCCLVFRWRWRWHWPGAGSAARGAQAGSRDGAPWTPVT
jgi:hypothetical protein